MYEYYRLRWMTILMNSNIVYWKKARLLCMVSSSCLSKTNLIQLIWDNFDVQDDTVEIWLSKDIVGSEITPRSLTDWAGWMSFPEGDNLKSSDFEDIPRLPKTITFVLSGLSIKQLSKHHLIANLLQVGVNSLSDPSRVVHGKRQ